MTELLKKAFAEASKLEGDEQDALGRWLLQELASQRRWDQTLANSQDTLAALADEALAEHRDGRTQDLDPQEL
ncbi:MAG: hypothetical protein IH983_05095 [Planctomycetes bacterium]|nr:hypothetical protein [Planctomycetota bacterium]